MSLSKTYSRYCPFFWRNKPNPRSSMAEIVQHVEHHPITKDWKTEKPVSQALTKRSAEVAFDLAGTEIYTLLRKHSNAGELRNILLVLAKKEVSVHRSFVSGLIDEEMVIELYRTCKREYDRKMLHAIVTVMDWYHLFDDETRMRLGTDYLASTASGKRLVGSFSEPMSARSFVGPGLMYGFVIVFMMILFSSVSLDSL